MFMKASTHTHVCSCWVLHIGAQHKRYNLNNSMVYAVYMGGCWIYPPITVSYLKLNGRIRHDTTRQRNGYCWTFNVNYIGYLSGYTPLTLLLLSDKCYCCLREAKKKWIFIMFMSIHTVSIKTIHYIHIPPNWHIYNISLEIWFFD